MRAADDVRGVVMPCAHGRAQHGRRSYVTWPLTCCDGRSAQHDSMRVKSFTFTKGAALKLKCVIIHVPF